jgi:hypothetical protein
LILLRDEVDRLRTLYAQATTNSNSSNSDVSSSETVTATTKTTTETETQTEVLTEEKQTGNEEQENKMTDENGSSE